MQLDGAVETGSIERRLQMRRNRESVFETDDRTLIDPENAAGLITEAATPKVARETVRQTEIALE